jgi:glycosyltransferase 2 family protein
MSGRGGRRRAWRYAAGLLVLAFIVLAVARGWSEVSAFSWRLSPLWLIGGLVALFAYLPASAAGYVAIVERLAPGVPLRRRAVVRLWATSLLGRYVPGNVMMVAGRLELGLELGLPRKVSLAASVYEQVIVLGVSAVAGTGFLLLYGDLGETAALWGAALIPLVLALLHPALFRRTSTALLRRLGREPLSVFLSGRQVVTMVAWYVGVIALQGLAAWLLIRSAAGPAVGGPAFVTLAFALAFTVAMVAFVFPSGLGVRDGLFALALAVRLPDPVAAAIAVGFRLVTTLAEIAFAAGMSFLDRRARRDAAQGARGSDTTPVSHGAPVP